VDRAREVFAPTVGTSLSRVGVFGSQSLSEIAATAEALELAVVQIHDERTPDEMQAIGRETGRDVWAVVKVAGSEIPEHVSEIVGSAAGVVLDTRVPGRLGGTGIAFDWSAVRDRIAGARNGRRLVLAGGLTPDNVAGGIRALSPDVVDVSSGVEAHVGEKDHARMAAFALAARSA
jgi:phosphoribosylanthranilate isomerase